MGCLNMIEYTVKKNILQCQYIHKDVNGCLIYDDFKEYNLKDIEIFFKYQIIKLIRTLNNRDYFTDINKIIILDKHNFINVDIPIYQYQELNEINVSLYLHKEDYKIDFYNDIDFYVEMKRKFYNVFSNMCLDVS